MKIVFLDAATLGDASLESIRQYGTLTTYPTSTPQEALARVKGTDILIVNKVKVTSQLMDAAGSSLKLICEAATGVNNIDLDAAALRGIKVLNVAGYSTDSVVQITFAHILNLICDSVRFDAGVKNLSYSRSGLFTDVSAPYMELAGKTLGVIGMGAIGQKVAWVAKAFGMNVIYFSTSGTSHCKDYPSVDLDTLLSQSDVVTIHAPLNERTSNLIDTPQLRRMKPGAIIVNMARGGIVSEKALADAISDGTVAGAALDVFTSEPLPEDSPLLHTAHPERLRFTPHIAWASREAIERLVEGIAANIASTLNDLS